MAWFFASSASFSNANSEAISNPPINLAIVSSYAKATHQPEGTTLVLYAISFLVDATTLYLCYPNEAARDADHVLLLVQVALPSTIRAGWHTAATFTNGSGESIVNKNFNLDIVSSYSKTRAKPYFTSEVLYAIALVGSNKNKPEYLYYSSEGNRDADYILIQSYVSAIANYSPRLVYTPTIENITGTTANAWIKRTLAIGANKTVQIKVTRNWVLTNPLPCGVRQVGSSDIAIDQSVGVFFKTLQTDNNSEIEIFANSLNVVFTVVDIITIL